MAPTIIRSSFLALLCAALGFSTSALAEAQVNISGTWKIDTHNGPIPLCEFIQAGNTLTGSCIGPQAKGMITGTIVGKRVDWHWEAVTYVGDKPVPWDFMGIFNPDNKIMGMTQRRGTNLVINFTAKPQNLQADGYRKIIRGGRVILWTRYGKPVQSGPTTVELIPPCHQDPVGCNGVHTAVSNAQPILTSPNVENLPKSVGGPTTISMQRQGGTFAVPVLINNAITLNFVVDSGAADVSIPFDVVMTLMEKGTINNTDFMGKKTYQLADGSTMPSETFRIRSLKVGDRILENVTAGVAPPKAGLLLGQSFLSRFNSWSLNNATHELVLQ